MKLSELFKPATANMTHVPWLQAVICRLRKHPYGDVQGMEESERRCINCYDVVEKKL